MSDYSLPLAKLLNNNKMGVNITLYSSIPPSKNFFYTLIEKTGKREWEICYFEKLPTAKIRYLVTHAYTIILMYHTDFYVKDKIDNEKKIVILPAFFEKVIIFDKEEYLLYKKADEITLDLLVPEDKLLKLYDMKASVEEIAHRFNVTETIIIRQLNKFLKSLI